LHQFAGKKNAQLCSELYSSLSLGTTNGLRYSRPSRASAAGLFTINGCKFRFEFLQLRGKRLRGGSEILAIFFRGDERCCMS
jgi:hypothetical protein